MDVKYQILELITQNYMTEYESGYGKTSTSEESVLIYSPVKDWEFGENGVNSFDSESLAIEALSSLGKKGTFTIVKIFNK